MPAKRYKVTCSDVERPELLAVIAKGKAAAPTLTRARMLVQAAQGPQGPAWSDAQMQQALHVGRMTGARTRNALVESGIEVALRRKPRATPGHPKVDGATEAHLMAVACSTPPPGQKRWTFQVLADQMIEREHGASIASATRRQQ